MKDTSPVLRHPPLWQHLSWCPAGVGMWKVADEKGNMPHSPGLLTKDGSTFHGLTHAGSRQLGEEAGRGWGTHPHEVSCLLAFFSPPGPSGHTGSLRHMGYKCRLCPHPTVCLWNKSHDHSGSLCFLISSVRE